MAKATEEVLGQLHGKLAKAMMGALEDVVVTDSDTGEVLTTIPCTNPSLFTAIAKFLKDNEVTMQIEGNEALEQLKQRTEAARARRKLPDANITDIADAKAARR